MTTETGTATILPEGEDMARQTAQAKMLREARDQLAAHARSLAEAKNRKALERMGLSEKRAKEIASGAPFTSEDLAELLGVALPTLRNWMAPADNKVHRDMPKTAKLLLDRILADQRKK